MARWIVKYHRWLLTGVILAAGGSATLLVVTGLRHDYRLEAFVASDDSAYRTYRRFLDEFTSNEVAIIAVQTDDALSPDSIRMVRDLLEAVRTLAAVQRAQALADLPGWALKLIGHRLREHRLIRDNLLSRDGRTAAILLQMQGETQSPTDRRRTVGRLREIVASAAADHPEARMILAGPYVTLIDMYDYVDRDLLVFSIAAFALLGLTLWVVFRRPGPMLFALLTGVAATCCALGVAIVGDFP
ncbi:MAG: MMPL family transporter, partial [Planctomycetes bacterium]|nr:MMPL family transporter [Planctomycetota bacterium]